MVNKFYIWSEKKNVLFFCEFKFEDLVGRLYQMVLR